MDNLQRDLIIYRIRRNENIREMKKAKNEHKYICERGIDIIDKRIEWTLNRVQQKKYSIKELAILIVKLMK